MKLLIPTLDQKNQLLEFDTWITPSLGEIRDTKRFRQEMEVVVAIFEIMGSATNNFANPQDCNPEAISEIFVKLARNEAQKEESGVGKNKKDIRRLFEALASVLFLVSGKSDNNAKCQFPIYLRDRGWKGLPTIRQNRNRKVLEMKSLPRELKASKYMAWATDLSFPSSFLLGFFEQGDERDNYQDYQRKMLEEFISFILSDEGYVSQLWSIGNSYFMLKPFGKERNLLSPLVMFQVRGSVSASGGHDPEELLRSRLVEWGLQADVDFNTTDALHDKSGGIIPSEEEEDEREEKSEETDKEVKDREKTRAYDFILPFRTPAWEPRIFIQCQFYAGDSGSVSHKNVDQTGKSRQSVLAIRPDARFVEYVDGAGYFSSLNGDLKKLLQMPTTRSFIQVKSAAIRLRRELQDIGFLTPLELEHAILRTDGKRVAIYGLLQQEGYNSHEIARCIHSCTSRNLLIEDHKHFVLKSDRRVIARRYLLLDVVANHGITPSSNEPPLTGSLLVPGYGPVRGVKLDDLIKIVLQIAPNLREDWTSPETLMEDIRWLCEQGLAISR